MARYEQSPRHVIEARYLGDYKVWLEFNDGRKGVVDLADELYGDEMSLLRNRDRFAAVLPGLRTRVDRLAGRPGFRSRVPVREAEGNELSARLSRPGSSP